MLRKISFVAAVAAILAIPVSEADARKGWYRGGGGHVHKGHFHVHKGHFHKVHFGHRHHFRHRPLFVVGLYHNPCWRWVPTAFGWRRVWVCNPYPYY